MRERKCGLSTYNALSEYILHIGSAAQISLKLLEYHKFYFNSAPHMTQQGSLHTFPPKNYDIS
jgi:hypothetical protein